MRKLTADDVTFHVTFEQDELSVRGNALASGDDDADREEEERILTELRHGNMLAWCCVTVSAQWRHHTGYATLGACSFDSESDFEESGYADDMRIEALADLNADLEALARDIHDLDDKETEQ
jgi:hypothetical protein